MREFGQYRIESLIGRGGMGEVHRAYDTRRDREVALKLLPPALSEDDEYQKRFRRESYTVARLREPHVIPIHDYGEIDDQLFIDMRLVDGRSVAMLLAEQGAMPPDRAVALVSQVAEALDAAHADGLVHRDVKPTNILVTSNDFVYVVDFGIAHAIGQTRSHLTKTGATIGTLDYMAPERFENRPIDRRTDVYSLACVLHECLTGTKPYPGGDLPSLMYGHLFLDPPKPSQTHPGVPAAFDAVIATGMAKDVEARFATAGEFAAAARAALTPARPAGRTADVPVVAPPVEDEATVALAEPATVAAAAVPVAEAPTVARPSPGPRPAPRTVAAPVGASQFAAAPIPPGVDARGPTTGLLVAAPPPDLPPPAAPPPPGIPSATSGGSRRSLIVVGVIALLAVALAVGVTAVALRSGGAAATPAPGIGPVAAPPLTAQKPQVGNSVAKPTVAATVPVGPTPGYMEIAPSGRYGYVANRAAGVLTVFDITRNQAVGTIPVPDGGPQFIAFAPDGSRAYVSIFNNERTINEVGVLDTAKNEFVAKVPTGVRPFALVVSPDGKRVYVPNHDSGSITIIDATTNGVAGEIKVAPNPHWVDISRDGKLLYAANHESNLVSVIDTATDAVLKTIPVGASPHSIVIHPTKPVVFNANYDGNSVSVIDKNTNAVIATVPTGNHPQDLTLAADGKYVYIATVDDNAIQVLDATTYQITATVPTGKAPTSVAVGPDGRQAYVTNLNDGTVTVLNTAGTA